MDPKPGTTIERKYTDSPNLDRQASALMALLKASDTSADAHQTYKETAVIAAASKDRNQGHVSGQAYRGDQR